MSGTGPAPAERDRLRALPWVLGSGLCNSVFATWTFGGSVFLLFLAELGLPKSRIGVVLSLFPFCGLLALAFAPAATRWGRKRVFLLFYGVRKLVMAGLLLLPWMLARTGPAGAMAFLLVTIGLFAVLRALAETAYYPWSQEFVPNRVRGRFTALSTVITLLASAAAVLAAGRLLGRGPGMERFLVLIGAGCGFGLAGVAAMIPVPGGDPAPGAAAGSGHGADLAAALRDGNFRAFLAGMGCMTLGSMFLISFLPLYVREQIGLADGAVVRLDAAMMAGGIAASLLAGRAADRVGSRPVLMPAMALCAAVAVGWLLLPRAAPGAGRWCAALYFVYGVAIHAVALGSSRLLFNGVVPPERNTAYTAVYYAWLGLTGGIAPLLAGGLLSAAGRGPGPGGGHAALFALAAALLGAGTVFFGRVRPDHRHTTRSALRQLAALVLWRLFSGRSRG